MIKTIAQIYNGGVTANVHIGTGVVVKEVSTESPGPAPSPVEAGFGLNKIGDRIEWGAKLENLPHIRVHPVEFNDKDITVIGEFSSFSNFRGVWFADNVLRIKSGQGEVQISQGINADIVDAQGNPLPELRQVCSVYLRAPNVTAMLDRGGSFSIVNPYMEGTFAACFNVDSAGRVTLPRTNLEDYDEDDMDPKHLVTLEKLELEIQRLEQRVANLEM